MSQDKIIGENLIEVAKRISASTPPLYIRQSEKPELVSSSMLLRHKENYFLVTAAHTLRQFQDVELGLIFNRKFLPLSGQNANSYRLIIDKDRVDVGFYNLSRTFLEQLSPEHQFFDLQSFGFDHEDSSDNDYLIVGHTVTRTKVVPEKHRIELRPFLLMTDINKQTELNDKTGTSQQVNILLNYPRKKLRDLIPGNSVHGPEPNGLSGCGIWKILNKSARNVDSIKFHPTGMIIEYFKNHHLLVGTRLRIITECLRQAYDSTIPFSKSVTVRLHPKTM